VVPVNHIHNVYENFLSPEECSHISKVLIQDEQKVLNIPNPEQDQIYTGLTKQHTVYNWLNHRDIKPLNIPQRLLDLDIFESYNHLKIQCWGNILRQGENIPLHQHHGHDTYEDTTLEERSNAHPQYPLVASNIFLSGIQPSYTHYEDTGKTENIIGELHIVGSLVRHEVKTQVHQTPRVSLAMDIFFDEFEDTEGWGFFNEKRFVDVYRNNV
jgi:hypothetical protein